MIEGYKIAICRTINEELEHSTSWNIPWIEYCQENKIDYEIINPYESDIMDKLKNFNCLLWHFGNYEYQDMFFARSILYSAKQMGLDVFPDFYTAWHFDDKIAETYLLQSIKAPIPISEMFYNYDKFTNFIDANSEFPLVAKLRCGSGSHNVKLLKNKKEALAYGRQMLLRDGYNPAPSLLYKASSNIKSAKSLKKYIARAKRIPEFFRTLNAAKKFSNEKLYVFLQEFIPNDGYDLKIVVVGDKLSFISRDIRSGEFRASGGGSLNYDKSRVPKNVIESAFKTSDELKFQCIGYDYVVDSKTGDGKIIEISYGFSHAALLAAGGYFDRQGTWHSEPMNAPKELLKNILYEN